MSFRTNFQDWEPVVLTKHKTKNFNNNKSKSNIHINNPKIEDDNEAHRIIKYTQEQKDLIINARNSLGLTQKELAQKFSLNENFIKNIENGKTPFNQQTFNKIKSKLGIK